MRECRDRRRTAHRIECERGREQFVGRGAQIRSKPVSALAPDCFAATTARSAFLAVDLDRALRKLEESQPRAAQVVELRFFGGMSVEEIAQSLAVAPATVKRDWLAARLVVQPALR